MTFAANIYVDANKNIYGASDTDQRHTKATTRTVHGRPVAYAGTWFGSQMSYRPFRLAVELAAQEAAKQVAKSQAVEGTV